MKGPLGTVRPTLQPRVPLDEPLQLVTLPQRRTGRNDEWLAVKGVSVRAIRLSDERVVVPGATRGATRGAARGAARSVLT